MVSHQPLIVIRDKQLYIPAAVKMKEKPLPTTTATIAAAFGSQQDLQ
jgi:hypothetical protein